MELYPQDLDHPFRRSELSTLGIGWRQVAGPLWRSPYRNVHVWSATDPTQPRQRALDVAALVPDGAAIGTWAAACIGGAIELDGCGSSGWGCEPVVVALPPGRHVKRGPGIRSLQSPLSSDDIVELDGVRLTTPVRTAFDLARTESLADAVVAIDYLGRGRPEFRDEVRAYAEARPRWWGSRQARRAARLASDRSRSAGETRLRLLWMLEARLAAPEVNPSIFDESGNLLGMADLLDATFGLVGEYDGAGHREIQRHADDNAREEWLEAAGLVVVRVGAPDLAAARQRTVLRLKTAALRAEKRRPRRWHHAPGPLPTPTPHWPPPDPAAA